MQQSKYIEEPHHHANYDDCVQDRLDGACHWDEPINQPQDYSDDDQGKRYLNKGMIRWPHLAARAFYPLAHDRSIECKKLFTCERLSKIAILSPDE